MALFGNVIGLIGMACFLGAYFMLQNGKIRYDGGWYLGVNLAGSILLLVSLVIDWNLAAFLLEAAWALISMYGLYRHVYCPRRQLK